VKTLPYTCKFCGRQGTAQYHEEFISPERLNSWAALLCCNRCADFMTAKRTLKDSAAKVGAELNAAKCYKEKNPKALEQAITDARNNFTTIARKFWYLLNDYLHRPSFAGNAETLVAELMEKPEWAAGHLEFVFRREQKASKSGRTAEKQTRAPLVVGDTWGGGGSRRKEP
jgi:hypothetical protein